MKVPYTCPLIDEIIADVTCLEVDSAIVKLEELRKLNAALRYDAGYWKKLYEYARYGEMEYNPEVLPKE